MAQGPGHNAYMPGYNQVKHHEWRTAENSAAHLVPTLREMATTNPHLTLLDVGAGSGTISASLARYMPRGHVTATDLSAEILESAAKHARGQGVANISFQTASVYELPFPDDHFDIVHASMVLSHLDSPVEAYREMLRVTKPGGVMANRESDLRMACFYPDTAAMNRFQEILIKTMEASSGTARAGTQLVHWAMQAGVRRAQITPSFGTWMFASPQDKRMWGE